VANTGPPIWLRWCGAGSPSQGQRLFGRTGDEFVVPDGSSASLRELDKRFSLTLQACSRVVEIDRACTTELDTGPACFMLG
jgi:hypothetical protein